jgi:hypothetical protein
MRSLRVARESTAMPTIPVQIVTFVSKPQVLNAKEALPEWAAVLLAVTYSM